MRVHLEKGREKKKHWGRRDASKYRKISHKSWSVWRVKRGIMVNHRATGSLERENFTLRNLRFGKIRELTEKVIPKVRQHSAEVARGKRAKDILRNDGRFILSLRKGMKEKNVQKGTKKNFEKVAGSNRNEEKGSELRFSNLKKAHETGREVESQA